MNHDAHRPSPRLLPLGDAAWTIEFGTSIDPALHGRVMGLAEQLRHARTAGNNPLLASIVDVVPTFRSLTVHYDPLQGTGETLGKQLLELAEKAGQAAASGRRWQLPVCFDADLAPDLDALAASKGLSRETVIERLTGTTFHVYMIGFMPGFPYMGGLPDELNTPRLASPRKAVPARSLAIAGEMCAVYPWESPGGWHLLGRTPISLFDTVDRDNPALLASGDEVRWLAVDRNTYQAQEAALASRTLARDSFLLAPEAAWTA